MSFRKTVKSISRLRQIIEFLLIEGFEDVVDHLNFRAILPFGKKIRKKIPVEDSPAIRTRRVMERAGGAFVKFGQLLSLRPDLVPQEYCTEFAKLLDHVPSIPFSEVKKAIEKELNKPLRKVFKQFEEKPIAAASVAQVHRATLLSGEVVAVKVQRPGIGQTFEEDTTLLYFIAEQIEKRSHQLKVLQPKFLVEEFEKYTKKELDFLLEAKNIDAFYQRYKYHPHIKIPKVYWDYTTSHLITMEFIDGKELASVRDKLDERDRKRITNILYISMLDQVIEMHVFHADPHPGNIFVLKNGKIALLDFGIVGRISPDLAGDIEDLLVGLVQGDPDLVADGFLQMGVVSETTDINAFKEDLFEAWGAYHGSSLQQMNMRTFFSNTFDLARKYALRYPSSFVLLLKAFITLESVGEELDPKAKFVEVCESHVKKILQNKRRPETVWKEMKKHAYKFAENIQRLPQDIRDVLTVIKSGPRIKVDIENEDIQKLTLELDRSSNRLAYGIIIAGLAIASGLFILAKIEPILYGMPFLAWISLFFMAFFFLSLMVSIHRENKGGD